MSKHVTTAEVSACRVAQALIQGIKDREESRAKLRRDKIAAYRRPRKFLGLIDITRSAEQAVTDADRDLNRLAGENAAYYWHGHHISQMRKILDLAQAVARTPGATIRMSVSDFEYVSDYYNDKNN